MRDPGIVSLPGKSPIRRSATEGVGRNRMSMGIQVIFGTKSERGREQHKGVEAV